MKLLNELVSRIMKEYDEQSFKDPVARWLVESLLREGLNSKSEQQLRETAAKWFPE